MKQLVIEDVKSAVKHLADASGLVIFSIKNCPPCEALSEAIDIAWERDEKFDRITLNHRMREDCAFLRSLSIRSFPTVCLFSLGCEVRRVEGINPLDSHDDIVKYIESGLLQPEPATA